MSTHELITTRGLKRVGYPAERRMECPDCDLRVSFQINPAEQADDFARVLTEAHQQQILERR